MQLGMIGLGRMGTNMVRRLLHAGQECVVYDMPIRQCHAAPAARSFPQDRCSRRPRHTTKVSKEPVNPRSSSDRGPGSLRRGTLAVPTARQAHWTREKAAETEFRQTLGITFPIELFPVDVFRPDVFGERHTVRPQHAAPSSYHVQSRSHVPRSCDEFVAYPAGALRRPSV